MEEGNPLIVACIACGARLRLFDARVIIGYRGYLCGNCDGPVNRELAERLVREDIELERRKLETMA